jgi:predicted XRE-type DNA-binding protein
MEKPQDFKDEFCSASPAFWTCGISRSFQGMEKSQDLKDESCVTSSPTDQPEWILKCGMAKPKDRIHVVPSSGNVFADLGLPNAEEKQTKARLAFTINEIIRSLRLSQAEAARGLKVSQPKVSALLNYQLQGFSVERLMKFLTALDRDIEIVIHPKSRTGKRGRILVTAA